MKTLPTIGKTAAALLLAASATAWAVGDRSGGPAEIVYESLNNGGISYATNGNIKLGGTLGQYGLMRVGAKTGNELQSGFWKLENGCELYPVSIARFVCVTGRVAVTFNAMLSNVYTVAAITTEQGGPMAGTHAWTNLVATLTGAGGVGSVTTVYESVSALTNTARFYLIRCDDP